MGKKKQTPAVSVTIEKPQTGGDSPESPLDDFSDLFGDGSEPVRVELIRLTPKYVGDVLASGFLGELMPGTSLEDVRKAHGGGEYQIIKRDTTTGQIVAKRRLRIAGVPKVDVPPPPAPAPGAESASALSMVDGVQVGTDDVTFVKQLRQIVTLKALLQPRDVNEVLLEHVLAHKSDGAGGSLSAIKDVLGTVAQIRELLPESEPAGETSTLDLIKEALKTFGSFLVAHRVGGSSGQGLAPGSLTGTLGASPLASSGAENPLLPEQTPTATGADPGESPSMDFKQVAIASAYVVADLFRLGKDIGSVVRYLKQSLPAPALIPGALQNQIVEQTDYLFDTAEMRLSESDDTYADDSERRQSFSDFFNQVVEGVFPEAVKALKAKKGSSTD